MALAGILFIKSCSLLNIPIQPISTHRLKGSKSAISFGLALVVPKTLIAIDRPFAIVFTAALIGIQTSSDRWTGSRRRGFGERETRVVIFTRLFVPSNFIRRERSLTVSGYYRYAYC